MIEDYRKFDSMTRPVKFRWLKMLRQGLHRDVIQYKVYNILYKLHLLKRYSYRTVDEGNFSAPDFKPRTVETEYFSGTVMCKLSEVTHIEQDYFYKEKNGVKKIIYTIKDDTNVQKIMTCYLDNVCMKLGTKLYLADQLPTVKVAVIADFMNSRFDESVKIPQYEEVTYDLSPIKKLRSRTILNSFNPDEVTFTYTNQCIEFKRAMDKFTLKDLEVS